MNSDVESDWDSMSEGAARPGPPPGPPWQPGPPPAPAARPTDPAPAPDSDTRPDPPPGAPPGPAPAYRARTHQAALGETGVAGSSTDSGLGGSPGGSVESRPEGKVDTGERLGEDSDEEREERRAVMPGGGFQPFPDPEEKIDLLTFEEFNTKFFQIEFEDEGLLVDRAVPCLAGSRQSNLILHTFASRFIYGTAGVRAATGRSTNSGQGCGLNTEHCNHLSVACRLLLPTDGRAAGAAEAPAGAALRAGGQTAAARHLQPPQTFLGLPSQGNSQNVSHANLQFRARRLKQDKAKTISYSTLRRR